MLILLVNIFVSPRKDGSKHIQDCGTGGSCSWLWNCERNVSTEFWVSLTSIIEIVYKYDTKISQQNIHSVFCSTGREKDAQLCVYVGNEKVVDLWGSPSQAYTADTLTTVFSRHCHFTWFFMANLSLHLLFFSLTYPYFSTKSLTAIAMASLYDEGLLDYETR